MQSIKTVDSVFYRQLGDEIRKKRYEKGLTLRDVAKRTGYSRTTIDHWELGFNKIKPNQLEKLCEVLEITNLLTVEVKLGL